jgi:murein DD-endopeptidase MepM/ murein hydrolase activator NlpD
MSSLHAIAEENILTTAKLSAPFESNSQYPFSKRESIECGRWGKNSQDYPYFGAPRDRNRRHHAGIDIYPPGGTGSPVKALADGVIMKISPFYTRANGEVTYGILVDHGDFVANYAELKKPVITVSSIIRKGEIIGRISGTKQLHFELYKKGTKDWVRWHEKQPDSLIDPTEIMIILLNNTGS